MASATEAVAALDAAVDGVLAVDLDALADDELLPFVAEIERVARRVAPVQASLAAAVDRRGVAHERGCASTAALLGRLLRLSRAEARARVSSADRIAPRQTMSGEELPPLLPAVAAAQHVGAISPRHAAEIATTIDKLPATVDEAGEVAGVEEFFVDQARQFTPDELGKITRRLLDTIDPDGTLRDVDYRDRRRELVIHQRSDGTVTGRFEGTAEFGEALLTILDVTAAPNPAADGQPDQRPAAQRHHDGLLSALRLALRTGDLPRANGVVATIVLTATTDQWATDTGLARTGHGALIPVAEAKRIARGEARLLPTIFSTARAVAAYGTTHRLFTQNQRLALIARDGGCSFPGCTVPPAWCEADHLTDYAHGGPTTLDNGHLLCGHHHRHKDRHGWTPSMINGLPHWTPPPWLDPTHTPRRNHTHDPTSIS